MASVSRLVAVVLVGLGLCGPSIAQSNAVTGRRDPFWPVGYAPQVAMPTNTVQPVIETVAPVAEPPKFDPIVFQKMAAELQGKIRSQIRVSGFMKSAGGKQLATVNGTIVAEGDRLDVAVDNQTYRFRVTGISVNAVNLEPVN